MSLKLPSFFKRRYVIFIHDIIIAIAAWIGAYWLRYNLGYVPNEVVHRIIAALPEIVIVQGVVCWYVGLYRGIWHFASLPDLLKIVKASFIGSVLLVGSLFFLNQLSTIPRSIIPLYFILYSFFLCAPRILFRWLKDHRQFLPMKKNALIIGGGKGGEGLIRDLHRSPTSEYQPIAIVDDDPRKKGTEIHGIRVVGNTSVIPELVKSLDIDLIILAIPTINSKRLRELINSMAELNIPFCTLPGVNDLVEGRVSIEAIRKIAIEDVLGRNPIKFEHGSVAKLVTNQIILVTGGGGSIGSELCMQLAALSPQQLIVFENSEFNLYKITNMIEDSYPHLNFVPLLIDVADETLVDLMLKQYRPHIIFHAAAYKHVPILENQILVAVKNNILGTMNMAKLASKYEVAIFVQISTDKAVNPTNIMGLTKRIGELFCQNYNASSSTNYVTVRFGNVLDSAGSVVPLFRQQLERGGPLTVTHPEITRFFMTIKEAVYLVLQSSTIGKGGEIFVLDMGEPVNITTLATQMIRLAGYKVGEDIGIIYTGLRPGEKLYEELFYSDEEPVPTSLKKVYSAISPKLSWEKISNSIDAIEKAYHEQSTRQLLKHLQEVVPQYHTLVSVNQSGASQSFEQESIIV